MDIKYNPVEAAIVLLKFSETGVRDEKTAKQNQCAITMTENIVQI
jgi:hypothetical protein